MSYPSDFAAEIIEAIQSDIPHDLIAEVVGVKSSVISDWINDEAQPTAREKKIFRAAFGPIYKGGGEYMKADDEDIYARAAKARRATR